MPLVVGELDLFLACALVWILPGCGLLLPRGRRAVLARQQGLDLYTRDLIADSLEAALEEGDDRSLQSAAEFIRRGRGLPAPRAAALRATATDWLRLHAREASHVLLQAWLSITQVLVRLVAGPCLLAAWAGARPGGWQGPSAGPSADPAGPRPVSADAFLLALVEAFLLFECLFGLHQAVVRKPMGVWWARGLRSRVPWPLLPRAASASPESSDSELGEGPGADARLVGGGARGARGPAGPARLGARLAPADRRTLERVLRGEPAQGLLFAHRLGLLLLLRAALHARVAPGLLRLAAAVELFCPVIDLRSASLLCCRGAGAAVRLRALRRALLGLGGLRAVMFVALFLVLVSNLGPRPAIPALGVVLVYLGLSFCVQVGWTALMAAEFAGEVAWLHGIEKGHGGPAAWYPTSPPLAECPRGGGGGGNPL